MTTTTVKLKKIQTREADADNVGHAHEIEATYLLAEGDDYETAKSAALELHPGQGLQAMICGTKVYVIKAR